jgi:SAM-dependent methyltransferase
MRKNIFDNDRIWDWVDSNEDNKERFGFTMNLTPNDVESLIDIGCGHGGFLKLMSEKRPHVRCVGVDNSDGALAHITVEKVKASITDIPFKDREFDCAYALEVLEHLNPEDFKKALNEMARLSKKYIIVSVPYKEDIEWNMVKCPVCFTKFHYDGHLQVFDETKMENLFSQQGFKCLSYNRLGWSEHLKFHKEYVKLFYPEQVNKAPHYTVCPVCNTELNAGMQPMVQEVKKNKSIFDSTKDLIRTAWPKEKKSYWIIGLFEKNNMA